MKFKSLKGREAILSSLSKTIRDLDSVINNSYGWLDSPLKESKKDEVVLDMMRKEREELLLVIQDLKEVYRLYS